MPALLAVVLGILLGLASGGSLSNLAHLRLRFEVMILPLFLAQAIARGRLLGMAGASRWALLLWVASSVLLVGAMLANRKMPGMALGAAAVLLNLDVVLLNSAMPVALGGRIGVRAVESAGELAGSIGSFYRIADQGDILVWLGDVMPVTFGRSVMLVSPGDVVLMVAVAVIIAFGMTAGSGCRKSLPIMETASSWGEINDAIVEDS